MGPTAVHVMARRGDRGPWSIIADVPSADREPAGPPPGALVLAGIASCTIVTVAGVASRGRSVLEGMNVHFDVSADGQKVGVRDRTLIEADASEDDRVRFRRAADNCPVGKIFTKRLIEIEDAVSLEHGSIGSSTEPRKDPPAIFASGTVRATWLPATAEWTEREGRRVLAQEGEVAIHIETEAGPRRTRFGLLGGHTDAGWAPRPNPYAMSGLAASTLMTLRSEAASLGIDPASLRVEIRTLSAVPEGQKEGAQDAAAAGRPAVVRWSRRVSARAASDARDDDVLAAMKRDPVYGYCMRGDMFTSRDVVVAPPRVAALT